MSCLHMLRHRTLQYIVMVFYIPFDKLSKFLLSYETPKTTKELFGEAYEGPIMFDIEEERMAYKYITDNKMELNMTQWRQLLITGQLGEI